MLKVYNLGVSVSAKKTPRKKSMKFTNLYHLFTRFQQEITTKTHRYRQFYAHIFSGPILLPYPQDV